MATNAELSAILPTLVLDADTLKEALGDAPAKALRVSIEDDGSFSMKDHEYGKHEIEIISGEFSDQFFKNHNVKCGGTCGKRCEKIDREMRKAQGDIQTFIIPTVNGKIKGRLIIHAQTINGRYNVRLRSCVNKMYEVVVRGDNVTNPMSVKANEFDEVGFTIGSKLDILAHRIGYLDVSTLEPFGDSEQPIKTITERLKFQATIDLDALKAQIYKNYEKRSHELID